MKTLTIAVIFSIIVIYFNASRWHFSLVWFGLWALWLVIFVMFFLKDARSMDKDNQYKEQEHDFFKGKN